MAPDTGLTADAGRRLLRGAEALGGKLVAIVNSHAHADHFGGNAFFLERTAAKGHAPAQEEAILRYPDLEPFCLFGAAPRYPRPAGGDPGAGRSQPAQPGSDPKGDSGGPGEPRPLGAAVSGSPLEALLVQGLREIALPLGQIQTQQLLTYTSEIARWNQRVNLTGFKEPERIIREGVLRSLRLLPFLPEGSGVRLADVGSGAGFPGVPLKVAMPSLLVTLIEASRRRASFLTHVIHLLELNGISCLRGRVEALDEHPALRGGFDMVTARALAPLPEAMHLLTPLLAPGGIVLIFQGRKTERQPSPIPPNGHLFEFRDVPATPLLPGETVAVLRAPECFT
ncbi:MAG: 16S rRNA (guanine(527)-N(7))-methyltransferase RsmG [candidate division NC10 bacterium]|nr:16S rRNA (guanine(527)-N(7))-methyltransferase RsmG [candidate division NC10 bacterium]